MKASWSLSLEKLTTEAQVSVVGELLECLAAINAVHLRVSPTPLYEARVRYVRSEPWLDLLAVIAKGGGDCKDLSAWRVAELREAGEDARFHVLARTKQGEPRFHVQVVRASGVVEDPGAFLGMPAHA